MGRCGSHGFCKLPVNLLMVGNTNSSTANYYWDSSFHSGLSGMRYACIHTLVKTGWMQLGNWSSTLTMPCRCHSPILSSTLTPCCWGQVTETIPEPEVSLKLALGKGDFCLVSWDHEGEKLARLPFKSVSVLCLRSPILSIAKSMNKILFKVMGIKLYKDAYSLQFNLFFCHLSWCWQYNEAKPGLCSSMWLRSVLSSLVSVQCLDGYACEKCKDLVTSCWCVNRCYIRNTPGPH